MHNYKVELSERATWTFSEEVERKIIEYFDPGAEAAFFQEIAELVQLAELEQLESALEAKPDPLGDLSENLNKINICHEIREIPFPKDVQIPSRNRSVIVNVWNNWETEYFWMKSDKSRNFLSF